VVIFFFHFFVFFFPFNYSEATLKNIIIDFMATDKTGVYPLFFRMRGESGEKYKPFYRFMGIEYGEWVYLKDVLPKINFKGGDLPDLYIIMPIVTRDDFHCTFHDHIIKEDNCRYFRFSSKPNSFAVVIKRNGQLTKQRLLWHEGKFWLSETVCGTFKEMLDQPLIQF
jgi:hypothetical protein